MNALATPTEADQETVLQRTFTEVLDELTDNRIRIDTLTAALGDVDCRAFTDVGDLQLATLAAVRADLLREAEWRVRYLTGHNFNQIATELRP